MNVNFYIKFDQDFFLKSLQINYRKTKKYTSVFVIMNIANLFILKIFEKILNRI